MKALQSGSRTRFDGKKSYKLKNDPKKEARKKKEAELKKKRKEFKKNNEDEGGF